MKKLTRPQSPSGLLHYQQNPPPKGQNPWEWFCKNQPTYQVLAACLFSMQRGSCAYCEAKIKPDPALPTQPGASKNWHIEHFSDRQRHPKQILDWDNLFLSCDQDASCGKHKDTKGKPYNPDNLVDPAREDPDNLLRFRDDGEVEPRQGLSARDQARAAETIRVFNLNLEALRAQRRLAVQSYLMVHPDILLELELSSDAERHEYITAEIEEAEEHPWSATVRQLLHRLR